MDAWFELLLREILAIAALGAVGLGLTAVMGPSVDRAARLALAPAFGVAVTSCVLTTTVWLIPARTGWPVLVVLVVAGIALAWRRSRGLPRDDPSSSPLGLDQRSLIMLGIIVSVVLVTFSAPMAMRDSTGPVGTYVRDAVGYQAQIDGLQETSIREASRERPPWPDLTVQRSALTLSGFQQVGWDAFVAHFNEALGLHGSDTQAPLLVVLLLVGALGIFGAVRVVTASDSWFLLLGPLLVAGPFFRQLFYDGSQAAISGLVLVVPLALLGWLALRDRRREDLVLLAVLVAGLQTLYPLLLPPVVLAGVVVLAIASTAALRVGGGASARRILLGAVAVAMLAALFTPVAFERNVRYWKSILSGEFDFSDLPPYQLPFDVLPGWLLQTREFHDLNAVGPVPVGDLSALGVVGALVIPIFLLAVVAYALRRRPVLLGVLLIGAAAAILALRTSTHDDCSYCAQRNLLVIAPIAMALLGIGVVFLSALRSDTSRLAAAAVAVICLGLVGFRGYQSADRTAVDGFSLPQDVERVLRPAPDDGPLHLEGFGSSVHAPAEHPASYNRANESLRSPLSIAAEVDQGLAYLGGAKKAGVEFRPDYRYVLTRIGSVRTPRQVISRSGPVALERRTSGLDATVASGVVVAPAWADTGGTAWLMPGVPLVVWVVGSADPAFVEIELDATVPLQGASSDVSAAVTPAPSGYRLCARAPAGNPPRRVSVVLGFAPTPAAPPRKPWIYPRPPEGVSLAALSATRRNCGIARR